MFNDLFSERKKLGVSGEEKFLQVSRPFYILCFLNFCLDPAFVSPLKGRYKNLRFDSGLSSL